MLEELVAFSALQHAELGRIKGLIKDHTFLAEWRDIIGLFRVHVVQIVGEEYEVYSWEALSENLRREEGLPNPQRDITAAVQAAVQRMGLTWQEWGHMQQLTDVGVKLMHTGDTSASGLASALSRVDSMDVPEDLAHARGMLVKMVQYLINPTETPRPLRRRPPDARA